jgi:hypothetical protein
MPRFHGEDWDNVRERELGFSERHTRVQVESVSTAHRDELSSLGGLRSGAYSGGGFELRYVQFCRCADPELERGPIARDLDL